MNIPIEQQKKFIEEFKAVRPLYIEFKTLLEQILQKAVDRLGYMALVQARTKKVPSFSNKIIMKDKYRDPLTEVTDLCGARVVVHFQSQVEKVCRFIENNFTIDEANSLDLSSKLRVSEFGYRSVHYIVTPEKDEILGVGIDEKFKTLKAEIQVRTLAEHVWADISHDRIYKTELTIPDEWKREAARLAAILEDTDKNFAAMAQAIDAVSNVYDMQHKTEKAKNDIEKLKTLTKVQKGNPAESVKNVLTLVSVYNALNRPEEAKSLLAGWIDEMEGEPFLQTRLQFELAILTATIHSRNIRGVEYQDAIRKADTCLKELENMRNQNQGLSAGKMSFLYYRFGSLLQNNQEKSNEALNAVGKAVDLMPDNPFYLTLLLECKILRNIDMAQHTISLFKTTLQETITELEKLISLGIDAIPAWFAVGRCHFYLGNSIECIRAYSRAVAIIMNNNYTSNRFLVDSEIDRAGRLKPLNKPLAEQIRLYLNIAMAVSEKTTDPESYRAALKGSRRRQQPMDSPVVIVAGGASKMDEEKTNEYREYIEELMLDFRGTIISGGTTAGIPGLVGKVKAERENSGPDIDFELLAYLPNPMPEGAVKSEAYDCHYKTDSTEFSTLEVLTSWVDIVLSGIHPPEVMVIGINGGEIAAMEYRIALSLGARVCLVANSGRAVFDVIHEEPWTDHSNLIRVPKDPHTIWALVNQEAETKLTRQEMEELAPQVHDFYRRQRLEELKPETTDINKYKVVMEWEKLDQSLKQSNIRQVAFYEHIFERANLGIRKVKNPQLFNIRENVSREDYELLASLEHARWNAERLLDGWKYGPEKDLEKKLNPCIVAWDKLDAETRKWDYQPVDNIPRMLQKIGYEVYVKP